MTHASVFTGIGGFDLVASYGNAIVPQVAYQIFKAINNQKIKQ
jgi:hypothetical protein